MRFFRKRSAILLGAAAACFGMSQISWAASATLIHGGESAVVDGWNITVPNGVALTVTTSDDEIFVEKAANFTSPGEGLQIGFQSTGSGAATSIDFTDESIQNNSGKAFDGFQFILLNTGSANAKFAGASNEFAPPSGTGYNFTSVNLNGTADVLTYAGNQDSGATSLWGSAAQGDNLLINASSGSEFSFKEISSSSGGGGGGGTTVPLPAAAWQSLATLGALGLIGTARWKKQQQQLA